MTILQLISSGGFYGAESMLVALSESLARMGCKMLVGVLRDARDPHVEVAAAASARGLAALEIPCDGRFDWKTIGAIRELVKEHSVDAIHAHGYKADLFACLATWPRKTRLISTCHNWPNPALRMQTYAKIDRRVLKSFHHVTTPSPHVADILRSAGIRDERLHFIRNGVDTHRFDRAEPTLRQELRLAHRPVIGFVGRLVEPKGGEVLLHAARRVLKIHPDATFVFVGDGPDAAAWRGFAKNLGVGESVIFAGQRNDMPSVYASLDLLVLPSFDEAMPMCLLEAMAAGKAVVSTSVGAVPQLIEDEKTGLLVEPHHIDPIGLAITRLLDDPGLRFRLAAAGREHIRQNYSADAMARQYFGLYQQDPTLVGWTRSPSTSKTSTVKGRA
jgi:glycosyltransferase involved in cell wall biosynthesis